MNDRHLTKKENDDLGKRVKQLLFVTKKSPIRRDPLENKKKTIQEKEKVVYSFTYRKVKEKHFHFLLLINFLYSAELGNLDFKKTMQLFCEELAQENVVLKFNFSKIKKISDLIRQEKETLDFKINQNLKNWKLDRISLINKIILRWGIFFLTFDEVEKLKLTKAEIIPLAITLAKWFGSKKDYKFINGLLQKFYQQE